MKEETKLKISAKLKGRKKSPEHLRNISLAIKGRKLTAEWIEKLRQAKLKNPVRYWLNKSKPNLHQRGEKSNFWKGGISSVNQLIRASGEYRHWRRLVFERDDYTCQLCFKRGGKLNADHIKPFSKYPELRLDISNGRTLCVPCHRTTETYGVNDFRPTK